ncbi:hypothetical protein IX335_000824 [Porphyromonas levii]|uniref:hypothetical protein n=1 Tax=Porphyromonas levii TaxID=28114 RepID=UPI001BAB5D92|nr:hypothetical protein [Porphyromonas levii]MBR8763609.1 hypothetical protein [Porphyromonas levii]
MADDIITKHNFELCKAEIKRSSDKIPEPVNLEKFQTDGSIIPWNDHNVTGSEINDLLVKPLQKALIKQNDSTQSIYKILQNVYCTLDYLDKEYIAGIITAVKSAEEASNQARKASDKATLASSQALDASDKAITAQEDIKRTIEALQKAVGILKDFKENVDRRIQAIEKGRDSIFAIAEEAHKVRVIMNRITHLRDLDTIWSDVEEHKANLAGLHQKVEGFVAEVTEATQHINRDIVDLQGHRSKLENYVHLGDIDTIWSDVQGHKANLAGLHQKVEGFVAEVTEATQHINRDIVDLQGHRSKLENYVHLGDIDTIWSDVEGHKVNLARLHQRVDSFIQETQDEKHSLRRSINELRSAQQEKNEQVDKKLKVAYGVAGGAVALSLTQLILLLLGIL